MSVTYFFFYLTNLLLLSIYSVCHLIPFSALPHSWSLKLLWFNNNCCQILGNTKLASRKLCHTQWTGSDDSVTIFISDWILSILYIYQNQTWSLIMYSRDSYLLMCWLFSWMFSNNFVYNKLKNGHHIHTKAQCDLIKLPVLSDQQCKSQICKELHSRGFVHHNAFLISIHFLTAWNTFINSININIHHERCQMNSLSPSFINTTEVYELIKVNV